MSDGFPVPKPKVKQLNNVLTEEEYLQRLENIIKRDYYPELYRLDKMKKEDVTQDENMSLSQFLSTYTSDENVTLTEIIKKGDDSWYQKHSWMFQAEEHHRMKQAALQSNKLTNMVEGNRENNLQLNEYKALNPLYFRMDPNNEKLMPAIMDCKETEQSLQLERVDIKNTRFEDHHKPLEFAITQIDQKLQKRKLAETLNAQGVNVFYGSTPNLVGVHRYDDDDMLGLFSPAPQHLKTPLMTWGELGETPVRLDRNYTIPPSPQRDKVGSNLAQQLNVKKRNEQKQQEELLKRRLSSITPHRIGSNLSSRANSELIKNFFDRRGTTHHTPLNPKSRNIKKP